VRRGTLSSCLSAATSKIVKRWCSRVSSCRQRYIKYSDLYLYLMCVIQETRAFNSLLRTSVPTSLWSDSRSSPGGPHESRICRSALPALLLPARLPAAPPPTNGDVDEQRRSTMLPQQVHCITSPCRRRCHGGRGRLQPGAACCCIFPVKYPVNPLTPTVAIWVQL